MEREILTRDENRICRNNLRVGMRVRGFNPRDNRPRHREYTGTVRRIGNNRDGEYGADIERDDRYKGGGENDYNGVQGWVVRVRGDGFWGMSSDTGYLYSTGRGARKKKTDTIQTHRKNLARLIKKYRKPHPIHKHVYERDSSNANFLADYFNSEEEKIYEILHKCQNTTSIQKREGVIEWL